MSIDPQPLHHKIFIVSECYAMRNETILRYGKEAIRD